MDSGDGEMLGVFRLQNYLVADVGGANGPDGGFSEESGCKFR